MSLLIKALDKAQAEKAKAKEADAKNVEKRKKKSKVKKTKVNKDVFASANEVSDLSLSPEKEGLIDKKKFAAKTNEAAVDEAQRRTARALTVESVPQDTEVLGAVQKTAQMKAPSIEAVSNQAKSIPNTKTVSTSTISSPTPMQAANVFAAKQSPEATNSNATILLIAAAGLIAMIAMGIYYYQFVDNSPEIIVPQRQIAVTTTATILPDVQEVLVAEAVIAEEEDDQGLDNASQDDEMGEETNVFAEKKVDSTGLQLTAASKKVDVESTLEPNEVLANANTGIEESNFIQVKKIVVSDSASIRVIKNQKKPSVNPVLMRAYAAYQTGNDNAARGSYKEVLRTDRLNVDALLGLGAIAMRQGRLADANDWYRRVLQAEPRNDTAKAALLHSQTQISPQIGDESRIRSMLAKSPNDASLYAALGDFYIEQNQWPAAQQAYFDAYRLNNSADNAFNLAVCLDQMSKPKLALPYYQQALVKAERSQKTSIDVAALQARINSIK